MAEWEFRIKFNIEIIDKWIINDNIINRYNVKTLWIEHIK
jgi:hypothetical protein